MVWGFSCFRIIPSLFLLAPGPAPTAQQRSLKRANSYRHMTVWELGWRRICIRFVLHLSAFHLLAFNCPPPAVVLLLQGICMLHAMSVTWSTGLPYRRSFLSEKKNQPLTKIGNWNLKWFITSVTGLLTANPHCSLVPLWTCCQLSFCYHFVPRLMLLKSAMDVERKGQGFFPLTSNFTKSAWMMNWKYWEKVLVACVCVCSFVRSLVHSAQSYMWEFNQD